MIAVLRCCRWRVVLCVIVCFAIQTSAATRQFLGVYDLPSPRVASGEGTFTRQGESVAAVRTNGGSIAVDPFLVVGGTSGTTAFFWDPDNGGLLESLDVWVGKTSVAGVQVKLSSGAVHVWGQKKGNHSSLTLELGEKITNLSLWDNGQAEPKTRFGALRIETSMDQMFEAGLPKDHRGQATQVPNGSGYVLAASGQNGEDVAAFGLCFLRPIQSAVMQVSQYPTLQTLSPAGGNLTQVLAHVTYNNYGDSPEVVRMMGAPTVTAVHEWNFHAKEKLGGVPVSVKAGVPRVVDVEGVPTSWTVSESRNWPTKTKEKARRDYNLPLTVPPHSSILAKATLAKLDLDVDFNGMVIVLLANGATWPYRTSGRYTGLAYAVTVTLSGNETVVVGPMRGSQGPKAALLIS